MKNKSVRTIADIAEIAGVSKSTVSRALNDSPLVSAKTKDRVQAIASEHGFELNAQARRLSTRRSRTIAFVTHAHHGCFSWVDLFDFELLGGITQGLSERGYDLLVVHVGPKDRSWARTYLETGRVDGFVLMTSSSKQTHVQHLLEIEAPFIGWGFPLPGQSYCSVICDDRAGGRIATEHMLRDGRHRIAFVGGWPGETEVKRRYEGYVDALGAAGQDVDPKIVGYGNYKDTVAADVIGQMLDKTPDLDGVFVNSDIMAIAVMDVIRERGKRVPEDIAVIGYDDLSIAAFANPPLTTVRQNVPEAGRLLAKNLIEFLETGLITNVMLPVELIVRSSA